MTGLVSARPCYGLIYSLFNMITMVKLPRKVLFLVDTDDASFVDGTRESEHWDVVTEILDFRSLETSIPRLRRIVNAHNPDFVLYSQNEQVGKRAMIGSIHQQLGLGYSSISAIDRGDQALRVAQMKTCFEDFLECGRAIPLAGDLVSVQNQEPGASGTFSIVFDTEQLGGIRYGVPRILQLLSHYGVPATFFVTDLMNRIYTDLFSTLAGLGHELAPHGLCHEHLAPLPFEQQVAQIERMVEGLGVQPVGGNFIYRMNEDTVDAMVRVGFRYFVFFDMCSYRLTSYSKRPTHARLLQRSEGDIFAIPVPVETYGSPWFSIRNMLSTAIEQSRDNDPPHVTILGHPFRDGGASYIDTTRRLIEFMLDEGFRPTTLAGYAESLDSFGAKARGDCTIDSILHQGRAAVALPTTGRDLTALVPQTAVSIMRKLSGRTIF